MNSENIQISDTFCGSFNLLIWKNSEWKLFSNHKYESDAKEIKKILLKNSISKAKEEILKMDNRINKVLIPYYIN